MSDTWVTYVEAAELAGVPLDTVRQWRSRHHLNPVGRDPDGRLLFDPADVLDAERRTRQTPQGRHRKSSEP